MLLSLELVCRVCISSLLLELLLEEQKEQKEQKEQEEQKEEEEEEKKRVGLGVAR